MEQGKKEPNGLFLQTIESESIPIESEIKNIIEIAKKGVEKQPSFVVAYLDYEVRIGKFDNGHSGSVELEYLQNELEYLQKLRIFNKNEELYIWRSGVRLFGRMRRDGKGNEIDVVDAYQILFGTEMKRVGEDTMIYEDRGTEIILPGDWQLDKADKKKRVAIKTRNYIQNCKHFPEGRNFCEDRNSWMAQASYIDCRFMEFVQMPRKNDKNDDILDLG